MAATWRNSHPNTTACLEGILVQFPLQSESFCIQMYKFTYVIKINGREIFKNQNLRFSVSFPQLFVSHKPSPTFPVLGKNKYVRE